MIIEFMNSIHPILECLIVCLAKILEISVQSLKTVCMVKGQRVQATLLAFLECIIWGVVISSIITTLGHDYFLLLFYSLGYAAGLFIGSKLEDKIALGTSSVQIMIKDNQVSKVCEYLNSENRGFTILEGKGATESRSVLIVVLPRKETKQVIAKIRELCDNEAFVVSSEVSKFVGGYGVKK